MKFRDVIRHYIGCQVQTTTEISIDDCDWGIEKGEIMTLVGINSNGNIGEETISNIDTYGVVLKQGDKWVGTHISDIKPLLLSLEDMTEEDMKGVFKLIFKRDFPDSGNIQFRTDTSLTSDPRWILWSGVDRVGIEISGDVWADCDLSKHKFNPHIITHYLTSKHYDVFGLIDSGQAIRKTV